MIETAQILQVLGNVRQDPPPAHNLEWALALRAGLNYTTVTSLARHTGFAPQRIFAAVNLSARTMERRKKQKKLSAAESQKIARFARVVALGHAVFEDPQVISRWLERENPATISCTHPLRQRSPRWKSSYTPPVICCRAPAKRLRISSGM